MVVKLSFEPNGGCLSLGTPSIIINWNLNTWQSKNIPAHLGPNSNLRSIAINPDGKLIASVGNDARVRIWDAETGGLVNTWIDSTGLHDVSFNLTGDIVTTAGGVIRFWDYETGLANKTILFCCDEANSIAYHPNGEILVSGGRDYITRFWDVNSGMLLSFLDGPIGRLNDIAFSPDGELLATGGSAGVLVWQVDTGELLNTIDSYSVRSIDFNTDGSILAVSNEDSIFLFGVTSSDN